MVRQPYSIKTLLVMMILALLLPGCGVKSYDRTPNPNMGVDPLRVKTGGLLQNAALKNTLRIGTTSDFPPFSYHGTGDRLTGFDVEIAEEVARHLKMKAVFVEVKENDLLPGLSEGKYDAVFSEVADSKEHRELYDLSQSYTTSATVLAVRSNESKVEGFTDLKEQTVVVEKVDEYQQLASKYGAKTVVTNDLSEAVDLLVKRKADAIITNSLSLLNLSRQTSDFPLKTAASLKPAHQICAAFPKGNSDLVAAVDNALEAMHADGSYLTIWNKYFGDSPAAYKGTVDHK